MKDRLKVFSGQSNLELAKAICQKLDVPLSPSKTSRFANDNQFVQILENVREKDTFVVQTSSPPVDSSLIELLLMVDALHRASAKRITAVIPYFHYVRSDKKDEPRIAIAARLVADLLEAAGVDRVLTMTLHSEQIQGFFRIPVDQLSAAPIICDHFRENNDLSNCVAVAPDAGSAKRAGVYAERLNIPLAVGDKRRVGHADQSEIVRIVGEVEGRDAIMFDDEIATAGSMLNLCQFLTDNAGVKSVRAAATHGVLCGDAIERLDKSPIEEVVITDTIPPPAEEQHPKIKVLSVAPLFARAMANIHSGESVSALFK